MDKRKSTSRENTGASLIGVSTIFFFVVFGRFWQSASAIFRDMEGSHRPFGRRIATERVEGTRKDWSTSERVSRPSTAGADAGTRGWRQGQGPEQHHDWEYHIQRRLQKYQLKRENTFDDGGHETTGGNSRRRDHARR